MEPLYNNPETDPEPENEREKEWAPLLRSKMHPNTRRAACIAAIAAISTASVIILLLLILILVSPLKSFIPGLSDNQCDCTCPPSSSSPSSSSESSTITTPYTTTYTRTYIEDAQLNQTNITHAGQKTWDDILFPTRGKGAVLSAVDGAQNYGISMFHQLHCLTTLRGIVFPETSADQNGTLSIAHTDDHVDDITHWGHCFDYIAQAILCNADDALEPAGTGIGHGITHQCRDARILYGYSEESFSDRVDFSDWKNGDGARTYLKGKVEPKLDDLPRLFSGEVQKPLGG